MLVNVGLGMMDGRSRVRCVGVSFIFYFGGCVFVGGHLESYRRPFFWVSLKYIYISRGIGYWNLFSAPLQ